jgi:hypothetical protein
MLPLMTRQPGMNPQKTSRTFADNFDRLAHNEINANEFQIVRDGTGQKCQLCARFLPLLTHPPYPFYHLYENKALSCFYFSYMKKTKKLQTPTRR